MRDEHSAAEQTEADFPEIQVVPATRPLLVAQRLFQEDVHLHQAGGGRDVGLQGIRKGKPVDHRGFGAARRREEHREDHAEYRKFRAQVALI
jgi:hypothetical protein